MWYRRLRVRPRAVQVGTNAHAAAVDLSAAARFVADRTQGWSDIAPEVFPLEMLVEEALEPMATAGPAASRHSSTRPAMTSVLFWREVIAGSSVNGRGRLDLLAPSSIGPIVRRLHQIPLTEKRPRPIGTGVALS